jgi:hypothetical protein
MQKIFLHPHYHLLHVQIPLKMFDVHQMEDLNEFHLENNSLKKINLLSVVRAVFCGVRKDDVADLRIEKTSMKE